MAKADQINLSNWSITLMVLIGVLLIVLVILYSCTDTFKSVGTYTLPVLKPSPSMLGTMMTDHNKTKILSNLQKGTVAKFPLTFKEPASSDEPPSTEEPASSEEPGSSEEMMPKLSLFAPRHREQKMKEPSLYSRLRKAGNSAFL